MPGFSHFLGNRTNNFRTLECLVTCFHMQSRGFVTMLVTSRIKDACSNLSMSNN